MYTLIRFNSTTGYADLDLDKRKIKSIFKIVLLKYFFLSGSNSDQQTLLFRKYICCDDGESTRGATETGKIT